MLVFAPSMTQGNEKLEQTDESIEISHPETLSVWGLAWPPILGTDNIVDLFHNVGFILYWPSLFFSFESAIRYLIGQSTHNQNLSQ